MFTLNNFHLNTEEGLIVYTLQVQKLQSNVIIDENRVYSRCLSDLSFMFKFHRIYILLIFIFFPNR